MFYNPGTVFALNPHFVLLADSSSSSNPKKSQIRHNSGRHGSRYLPSQKCPLARPSRCHSLKFPACISRWHCLAWLWPCGCKWDGTNIRLAINHGQQAQVLQIIHTGDHDWPPHQPHDRSNLLYGCWFRCHNSISNVILRKVSIGRKSDSRSHSSPDVKTTWQHGAYAIRSKTHYCFPDVG